MSEGLRIEVDARALRALLEQAAATPKQARAAVRRALRRTQKHIVDQSKKAVAREAGAPQKALRKRYVSPAPNEEGMEVWVGTWAIAPELFGKPRQTRQGVKVGRLPLFRGAFIGRVYNGVEGIYIRTSSKHYDERRYPGLTSRHGKGGGRFPVVRIRVPIEDAVVQSFGSREGEFSAFFLRQLEAELRWQTQSGGKQ